MPINATWLIESLRLLGLGLLSLVGQVGIVLGGWGVLVGWSAIRRGLGEPIGDGWPGWFPLAIGLVAVGFAGAVIAAALAGVRWLRAGLHMTAPRLFALLLAMNAAGIVTGIGGWLGCYHQADITRTWGLVVLVVTLLVGLLALAVSRPSWAAVALLAPGAVVAIASYDRLVDTTAATRCAGYQPPPVLSPPQPTVPDPGDQPTGEPGLVPTTTGPPSTRTPSTVAPSEPGE